MKRFTHSLFFTLLSVIHITHSIPTDRVAFAWHSHAVPSLSAGSNTLGRRGNPIILPFPMTHAAEYGDKVPRSIESLDASDTSSSPNDIKIALAQIASGKGFITSDGSPPATVLLAVELIPTSNGTEWKYNMKIMDMNEWAVVPTNSDVNRLQRRRVNNASTTDGGPTSPTAPTASIHNAEGSSASAGGGGYAGTAMEGGGKVAFDPRDLETDGEALKMPRLTLMEEVLLLGLNDRQGYLSFWNDNISYTLRGCIIMELALRRRVAMAKDSGRRRYPLPDRIIEVIDDRQTGETLLDEALKMIKTSEPMGTGSWIDLMSGETWNVMKIGYQLKQVRERLAKGLVDKGVLRTEKKNFLLFDMATHPVAEARTKEELVNRVVTLLSSRTSSIPPQALQKEEVQYRHLRAVCTICAAYAASVLENALNRLTYDAREAAFSRSDDILADFCVWPFGAKDGSVATSQARRREGGGVGGSADIVQELVREARKEQADAEDLCLEVVAAVLEVYSRMDSLL
ncbi:hypothetical protein FRB98_009079 [Tulasnella sp. 332]|nr:hypothetical protein FRB98_009079 [Tulasnella sp. 332]